MKPMTTEETLARLVRAAERLREESIKLETLNLGNADQKYILEVRVEVLRRFYRELYEDFIRSNL